MLWLAQCALLLLGTGIGWAQAERWDFEKEPLTWRPRSAGVRVELVRLVGTPQGQRALHIVGQQEGGWNYALSETRPMKGGQTYRLALWMYVKEMGEGTLPPSVKCEFVPAAGEGTLGRVTTSPYDPTRLGQWQKLSVEFRAPEKTGAFWLAVEKGSQAPMRIDLYIDDVVVEPIAEFSVLKQYALEPLPAPLQRLRGVHPRLYVEAAQQGALRERAQTTHAAQWQRLQALADRYVQSGPPAYRERDNYSGDEQLWQREVGNAMPTLALAWLITQERRYLESAQAWALASCRYPTWGLGQIDGRDLAAGHQLFGLAIVYDWCYSQLAEETRKIIRETLCKRANKMFEEAATGAIWWHRAYLQNHLWVNATGLAAAGLALYEEAPEASRWIGFALDKFARTMALLGPDGASHEGVGYWQYGVEYMLKFMVLARTLLEKDLYQADWWRETAYYALYLQLPRQAWTPRNNIVDLADCPRGNWYGPDYLLWHLASVFRNPYAQWQAEEEFAAGVTAGGAPWLNLLWRDTSVAPQPPTDLPTLRHFADLGIVSARSDWSGREALLVFKCGPFLGHRATRTLTYDAGGGHVHPDANHFVLFGAGEWLIRDDGYADKWTGQHNTLLIEGRGQMGEGQRWFQGAPFLGREAQPHIERALSTPAYDDIVGDATAAYPEALGLQRFVRHLLFVKPDVLLVLDDIACVAPRALELRFHPEQPDAQREGTAFLCRGKAATLRVEALTPEDVQLAAEKLTEGAAHSGAPLPLFTLRWQKHAAQWRNAVACSWAAAGESPPQISLQRVGERWIFKREGQPILVFDWRTRAVSNRRGGGI